jgi:hypothetical protein
LIGSPLDVLTAFVLARPHRWRPGFSGATVTLEIAVDRLLSSGTPHER